MAFYRGKRVSVYRKGEYSFSNLAITYSNPQIGLFDATPSYIRAIKHIRGVITVAPSDTSPNDTLAGGWAALVRFPRNETYSAGDLDLGSSAVLHPVAFAMMGAPHSFLYEHVGITLGQEEMLYFVVKLQQTSANVRCLGQLLYDKMVTPVAP